MHNVSTAERRPFLPAAGRDWALPLYDPLVKFMGADRLRSALITQANFSGDEKVLDIGCGTGTLAVEIKKRHPEVQMFGVDPDPKALARARHKATLAEASVQFDQGYADKLPYADASFDRVFSSFMLHHLPADIKAGLFAEARRVLKPGGSLHLMDFALSGGGIHGVARLLPRNHRLKDQSDPQMLSLLSEAGFSNSRSAGASAMLFGLLRVAYYEARRA